MGVANTLDKKTHEESVEKKEESNFCILEIKERDLTVRMGNKVAKYLLQNIYTALHTNEHFLAKGAFIGKTEDGILFLVRYRQKKEDPIVGGVNDFFLFDTTIVYASGRFVSTIDVTNAEKKVVIECEEPLSKAKILVNRNTLVVVCEKALHRLDMYTNLYTKVRLKVQIETSSACIASFEKSLHVAVSCTKGNIYVFDTEKMEMVKSMKSFGFSVTTMGFWLPSSTVLFLVTENNELFDIDYINNRLLKRSSLPGNLFTNCSALMDTSIIFYSNTEIATYSPKNGTFKTIYKIDPARKTTYIHIVPNITKIQELPDNLEPISGPQKEHGYSQRRFSPAEISGNRYEKDAAIPGEVHNPFQNNSTTSWMSNINEKDMVQHPIQSNADLDNLYRSFESFKDSVYKMQTDVLREVFLLKRKLEEIEKSLTR